MYNFHFTGNNLIDEEGSTVLNADTVLMKALLEVVYFYFSPLTKNNFHR